MEKLLRKSAFVVMATALALSVFATIPTQVRASSNAYSFNLVGPNSALAGSTIPGTPITAGDVLRLTGSGVFDVGAGTASGGGSFTHYKPDGTIFARGTWVITGLQSFTSYGGPSSGKQGGVLLVTVTLIGPEITFAGLTLQVSCEINAPPGAPSEGTTLPGIFGTPVGGSTLFHAGA